MSGNFRVEFIKWLENGYASKYEPSFCAVVIDKASEFAQNKDVSEINLWHVEDPIEFEQLRTSLLRSKAIKAEGKSFFKAFDVISSLYGKFLVCQTKCLLSKSSHGKSAGQANEVTVKERTIPETVSMVLKGGIPLTVKEIYDEIIKNDLYKFNAINPINIVTGSIREHCYGIYLPSRGDKKKYFAVADESEGNTKYCLLEYKNTFNIPSAINNIQRMSYPDQAENLRIAEDGLVGWDANVSYMKTKPRKMIYRDIETFPRSWNYLFVDVVNFLIKLFPNIDFSTYRYSNTKKQLILRAFNNYSFNKQLINGQYLDTNFSADITVKIIKDIFSYYDLDINELKVTIVRGGNLLCSSMECNSEINRQRELSEEEKQISELFKNNFKSGMRLGFIDMKKLGNAYADTYGEEISLRDNEIKSLIAGIALKVDEDRYVHIENLISQTVLDEIFLFVGTQFSNGRNRVWIEAITDIYGEQLSSMINEYLLMIIIERISNGNYKTNKNKRRESKFVYMVSQDLTQTVDEEAEDSILALLKEDNVPMNAIEIYNKLSCYPISKIKQVISSSNDEIVWLPDGKAVHVNYVYIDDAEFETVKEILSTVIERDDYIQVPDLMKRIQERIPSVVENNEYVGTNGVLKAIQFKFKELYDRKAARCYIGSSYMNLPDCFTKKEGN